MTGVPVAIARKLGFFHLPQEFLHLLTIDVKVTVVWKVNDRGLVRVTIYRLSNFDRLLTFPNQPVRHVLKHARR